MKSGLTPDEAKSAFNKNMMSSGFISDGPIDFGKQHKRRWYVTNYEAGDVVLHKAHMVRETFCSVEETFQLIRSRFTHQPLTETQTTRFGLGLTCALSTKLDRLTR